MDRDKARRQDLNAGSPPGRGIFEPQTPSASSWPQAEMPDCITDSEVMWGLPMPRVSLALKALNLAGQKVPSLLGFWFAYTFVCGLGSYQLLTFSISSSEGVSFPPRVV